jgi:hypothetical protein
MTKILLFILYMYQGQLKLDQKFYDNLASCKAGGQARVEELLKDPRVDGVVTGGCLEVPAQEV